MYYWDWFIQKGKIYKYLWDIFLMLWTFLSLGLDNHDFCEFDDNTPLVDFIRDDDDGENTDAKHKPYETDDNYHIPFWRLC